MIRRPPRSTQSRSSAASDVYKRQVQREGDTETVRPVAEQQWHEVCQHCCLRPILSWDEGSDGLHIGRSRNDDGHDEPGGQRKCARGHGEGRRPKEWRAVEGRVVVDGREQSKEDGPLHQERKTPTE